MKRLLLLTYFFGFALCAQNSTYNPDSSEDELYQYAEYVNVIDKKLSIEEVIASDTLNYEKLQSANHDLGFTSENYWVRFKLKNSSNNQKLYFLQTARPITDVANLYQISDDNILKHKNGDQIDFSERDVNHRETVFKILLPANTEQQFYLELSSDGETINVPLNLYDGLSFFLSNYRQQLFLGLFYGFLLLAGLVYLFFYGSLKNKSFLYYSFYVFSIALMQGTLDGFIYQYVFPSGGYLNSRMVLISAILSNFFLLKYCEYFLNVESNLPKFKKAYYFIYALIALSFILLFVSPKTIEIAYPFCNLNGLLSLLLILTTGFTMRFRKIHIDPYFSIGIFFLVVGLLGFVMNNLGILPTNFYTMNSSKFGSGFEVIFLSLSMTNLIRKLRKEKEASQALALAKSEEISGLKTYFMSNMSHELRTPINAIMGVVEAELSNGGGDLEARKKYQIIKNASLSLLSNVNDVLDFERIEKNELELKNEDFNPSITLNQISQNWEAEANRKGLDYTFEMDPDIPTKVNGDPDRFVQIINNLLSNAIKFTTTGSVNLKLKCLNKPSGITVFNFQISDTGVGMDIDSKRDVFDSFSQMRKNHKRQFGGIGLGLTIVKHLVDLFEGTIKIESEINKGTDVFIEIPLKEVAKTKAKKFSTKNNKNPLHILIVEDNKLNQMVMRKLLSSMENVTFAVVENGEEAIDTLKKEVYDLVLMDLQMPVMDGYEATKLIRSGALGPTICNIPIIAVTADAMDETRKRVLELGMNDYMTKPVKKDLLFNKIRNCTHPKLSVA